MIRFGSLASRNEDSRLRSEESSFWRWRSTAESSRTWRRVSASSRASDFLGDVVGGPGAEGVDRHVLAAVRRHQDHGQAGELVADALDQGQAVHPRHLEVGQDHRRRLAGDRSRAPRGRRPRRSGRRPADFSTIEPAIRRSIEKSSTIRTVEPARGSPVVEGVRGAVELGGRTRQSRPPSSFHPSAGRRAVRGPLDQGFEPWSSSGVGEDRGLDRREQPIEPSAGGGRRSRGLRPSPRPWRPTSRFIAASTTSARAKWPATPRIVWASRLTDGPSRRPDRLVDARPAASGSRRGTGRRSRGTAPRRRRRPGQGRLAVERLGGGGLDRGPGRGPAGLLASGSVHRSRARRSSSGLGSAWSGIRRNPTSRHRSRSPFMAWAVRAMIGTCGRSPGRSARGRGSRPRPRSRPSRASGRPSGSGRSGRPTRHRPPCGRRRRRSSSWPIPSSMQTATFWLTTWSSARRIRSERGAGDCARAGGRRPAREAFGGSGRWCLQGHHHQRRTARTGGPAWSGRRRSPGTGAGASSPARPSRGQHDHQGGREVGESRRSGRPGRTRPSRASCRRSGPP